MARIHQPMSGLDLLVAAHHGARDGFSQGLASIQRPAHVVFSQAKADAGHTPPQKLSRRGKTWVPRPIDWVIPGPCLSIYLRLI